MTRPASPEAGRASLNGRPAPGPGAGRSRWRRFAATGGHAPIATGRPCAPHVYHPGRP